MRLIALSSEHTRGKAPKPIGTSKLNPRGPDQYRCRKTSGTPGIAWFLYAFRADANEFSCAGFSRLFVDFGRDSSAERWTLQHLTWFATVSSRWCARDVEPRRGANVAEPRANGSRKLFCARARRFRRRAASIAASRARIARVTHFWRHARRAPRARHIAPRIVEATSRRRRGDARTTRRASSITAPRRAR